MMEGWGLLHLVLIFLLQLRHAGTQTLTVSTEGSQTYATDQALLYCDITFSQPLTEVTWFRDSTGTNETVYSYTAATQSGQAPGQFAARVDGSLNGTTHTLRINTTRVSDKGSYYCAVTDTNNDTVTNTTVLEIYFSDPASSLRIQTEGVSSLSPSPIYRPTPYTFTVSSTLPRSYPESDYFIGLYSSTTTNTTDLTMNSNKTIVTEASGITRVTVTTDISIATPGAYDVKARQIFPFKTGSSSRQVQLTVNVYGEDYDVCSSGPCQNNGTCQNTTTGFNCSCTAQYQGVLCETVVPPAGPPCDNTPCLNGATCNNSADLSSFDCQCTPCYNGTLCDQEILDPCASATCVAGFTCEKQCPKYSCKCQGTVDQCRAACEVRDPPPASVTVLFGDSYTLTCGLPPVRPLTITWYRNNREVLVGNDTLHIDSLTASTQGQYKCVLSESCSSTASTLLKLRIDIQPNNTAAKSLDLNAGQSEKLECISEGRPEPLLYWEWVPKPPSNPVSSTSDDNNTETSNTTTTTTTTTTTAVPTTTEATEPQRLTELGPSPHLLVLTDVTSSQSGTYVCRANVLNLTAEDIVIMTYDITIDGGLSTTPGTDCCKGKGGLPPWMLAIIILIIIIILVAVIVVIIILLHKGKQGEGPCVCCFVNSVHPDVKDREKDTQSSNGPSKYAATYTDEVEMEKKEKKREKSAKKHHIRRNSLNDSRHLVSGGDGDTPKTQSEEESSDDRPSGKKGRSKTPSPHSQNPIGSRARALPPLDLKAERKKQKKRKTRRNRDPDEDRYDRDDRDDYDDQDDKQDRYGSGDDSPSEARRDYRYRERDY